MSPPTPLCATLCHPSFRLPALCVSCSSNVHIFVYRCYGLCLTARVTQVRRPFLILAQRRGRSLAWKILCAGASVVALPSSARINSLSSMYSLMWAWYAARRARARALRGTLGSRGCSCVLRLQTAGAAFGAVNGLIVIVEVCEGRRAPGIAAGRRLEIASLPGILLAVSWPVFPVPGASERVGARRGHSASLRMGIHWVERPPWVPGRPSWPLLV